MSTTTSAMASTLALDMALDVALDVASDVPLDAVSDVALDVASAMASTTDESAMDTATDMSAAAVGIPGPTDDVVLFYDGVDPDNMESAVAIAKIVVHRGGKMHFVVTGRPLDTRRAPGIMKDGKFVFTLDGKFCQVEPKEIGKYVVQSPSEVYNPEEAQLLLGLYAVHVRRIMKKFGLAEGTHYEIYDGGVAKLAGISHIVHVLEWMRDFGGTSYAGKDLETFDFAAHFSTTNGKIITSREYNEFKEGWCDLSEELRPVIFNNIATAPPDNLRKLRHLNDLWETLRKNPGKIEFYGAGPATAIAETPPDIAHRVSVFHAMSGTFGGEENLLGVCFNDGVDPSALKQISSDSIFFPGAKTFLTTSDAAKCKSGAFTLTVEEFRMIGKPVEMQDLHDLRSLWVEVSGGRITPMFDLIPLLPPSLFIPSGSIVEVDFVFAEDEHLNSFPFKRGCIYVKPNGPPLENAEQMVFGKKYALMAEIDGRMKKIFSDFINSAFNLPVPQFHKHRS